MRFLLVLGICLCFSYSSALGQQAAPRRSLPPTAPQQTGPQQKAPQQKAPQQKAPQQIGPQPTAPQPAPESPYDLSDLDSQPVDDLSLDSNRSYDFDDFDSSQFSSPSDTQSSIASNSDFRGASPQMIGDFGGGSTILSLGTPGDTSPLSVQIPFAGGSRRIKYAENNQVQPLNRVYGTFNYFDNAIVSGGPGVAIKSESLFQYTMGMERTFYEDYLSIDLRLPLVGSIDHTTLSNSPGLSTSAATVTTSGLGNLSTSIKAHLLQMGQTAISGGLSLSIPTGSDTRIVARQETFAGSGDFLLENIDIDNDALHVMPFIGVYRPLGDSWWLQAFTQIDSPTSGNDVRMNGGIVGRLNEQTLLYSDISLGKWLYRKQSNRSRQRGVTGIASILELHYTGSLNDVDQFLVGSVTDSSVGSFENRFDVLNLTMGLQIEISERWRINAAGVVPLRDREFGANGQRREDQFFDGELSLQLNRFF